MSLPLTGTVIAQGQGSPDSRASTSRFSRLLMQNQSLNSSHTSITPSEQSMRSQVDVENAADWQVCRTLITLCAKLTIAQYFTWHTAASFRPHELIAGYIGVPLCVSWSS